MMVGRCPCVIPIAPSRPLVANELVAKGDIEDLVIGPWLGSLIP